MQHNTYAMYFLASLLTVGALAPPPALADDPDATKLRIWTDVAGDPKKPDNVRLNAVRSLTTCGPKAKPAIPALRACLQNDAKLELRTGAAEALGKIGRDAAVATPDLVKAFRWALSEMQADKDKVLTPVAEDLAWEAVHALLAFGPTDELRRAGIESDLIEYASISRKHIEYMSSKIEWYDETVPPAFGAYGTGSTTRRVPRAVPYLHRAYAYERAMSLLGQVGTTEVREKLIRLELQDGRLKSEATRVLAEMAARTKSK